MPKNQTEETKQSSKVDQDITQILEITDNQHVKGCNGKNVFQKKAIS
jgi:hypothetical protein